LEYLGIGKNQLNLWLEGVKLADAEKREGETDKQIEERLFQWLLKHDPNYCRIKELPSDIYARERYFLGNTMRGMRGYLESIS
ncbi:MAG: MBL fold metallo-hydrolase, partial [Deltaproteobacteria bacterium]|nr:MBL fold metallo-hydrolase [Candidatus Tharpella sp.]